VELRLKYKVPVDWWAPWMEDARCRLPHNDPETWFPEQHQGYYLPHVERMAKAICSGCPVRERCLRICLQYEASGAVQAGIWGGTLKRDRQAWRRRHLPLEEQVTAMLNEMDETRERVEA